MWKRSATEKIEIWTHSQQILHGFSLQQAQHCYGSARLSVKPGAQVAQSRRWKDTDNDNGPMLGAQAGWSENPWVQLQLVQVGVTQVGIPKINVLSSSMQRSGP